MRVPTSSPLFKFLLVTLIVAGVRLNTIEQLVVDWDESVYLVVAQDLVHGGSLYSTAWDHKGPFLYLALVPVVAIAEGSMVAARLYYALWLVATMFFVDRIARCLVSERWAFIAPLVYGLLFSIQTFGGLAGNAELFMMLPCTAAVWLTIRCPDSCGRVRSMLLPGFLASCACLIKPTVATTVATIPLMILILRRSQG